MKLLVPKIPETLDPHDIKPPNPGSTPKQQFGIPAATSTKDLPPKTEIGEEALNKEVAVKFPS